RPLLTASDRDPRCTATGLGQATDSASLSLERRALSGGLAEVSLPSARAVPSVKVRAPGFSVRRQHVRYTAIARRPAAQGKSTAHSARGTFATPDKPPLASWGPGALARPRRCFPSRSW